MQTMIPNDLHVVTCMSTVSRPEEENYEIHSDADELRKEDFLWDDSDESEE